MGTIAVRSSPSKSTLSVMMSTVKDEKKTKFRPNPVVVSAEAEALSHSDTTMKLTPSYDLFQLLTEEEGGEIPITSIGNAMRDGTLLKGTGKDDKLDGLTLSMFKGCGVMPGLIRYQIHSKWLKKNYNLFQILSKNLYQPINQFCRWLQNIFSRNDTGRDFVQLLYN